MQYLYAVFARSERVTTTANTVPKTGGNLTEQGNLKSAIVKVKKHHCKPKRDPLFLRFNVSFGFFWRVQPFVDTHVISQCALYIGKTVIYEIRVSHKRARATEGAQATERVRATEWVRATERVQATEPGCERHHIIWRDLQRTRNCDPRAR